MVVRIQADQKSDVQKELRCIDLQNYFSFISYGFTNPMPSVSDGIL
jgi:hypothetical protein